MKEYKKIISVLIVFSLVMGLFSGISSVKVSAYNSSDDSIFVTEAGLMINDVFYSQKEFEELLETAVYIEPIIPNLNSNGGVVTSYAAGTLPAGSWQIPLIGVVTITTLGVIYIQGKIVSAGSWAYNTVKTYFAEKSYDKAKEDGTKTDNHSSKQSTPGDSALSKTGTPLSSKDLKDSQGVKQRRYYDKNGKADLDIDFRHAGNYKFPHRHTWNNGVRSGH